MILPSVLSLEVLRRQTRVAIALPDSIREESSQRDLFHNSEIASPSSAAFTTASEHDEFRRGGLETWCSQSADLLVLCSICYESTNFRRCFAGSMQ